MDARPGYRLGFAVKVLGNGGLKSHDTRRWQSGPHLARSLELLDEVFDYLAAIDVRVYRLSSSVVPYGTHPDLPQFDFRRQLEACGEELERLAARGTELGLRLSTHPGQYSVLNARDEAIAEKARLDVEQDALLLDRLGQGPEGVVVIHVGGRYDDHDASLDRWAQSFERLSHRAQRRLVVEHDETCFTVEDVLELNRRTGVRVIYDHHHHRCNPGGLDAAEAVARAYATWPDGTRPKVHLSSPRTELVIGRHGPRPPRADQHAGFVTPWDAAELLRLAPGPLDVMLEAKAKDVALLWLRRELAARVPELAEREERGVRGAARTADGAPSPARTLVGS
jgi:UV DNA damage endonuclease